MAARLAQEVALGLRAQQRPLGAFNITDSAISVGAVALIVDELRRVRRERR